MDTSIFNAVLYLLSYLGKKIAPFGAKLSNLTLCLAQSHFCFYASHKRFTERAMRFELTTFSLARRRSTAELRPQGEATAQGQIIPLPHTFCKVDPVGFEPTIFSLQRRRLPARPRAQISNRCFQTVGQHFLFIF